MNSARLLRALALLGASASSLVLCVQGVFDPGEGAVIKTNAYDADVRVKIVVAVAVAFVLAVCCGVVVVWRCGEARLRWVSHRLAPVAVSAFIPPLLHPAGWPDALDAALAIAGVILLTERLLRVSFDADTELALAPTPPRPLLGPRLSEPASRWSRIVRRWSSQAGRLFPAALRRRGPAGLVVAMALGYGVYMAVFTLRLQGRFATWGYDLGQVDNIFWSTLHGHPMRDAPLGLVRDWSELRNHAELSVFFFLPFYALHPGAPALLVLQSCVLGLGAIPLYRFAARRLPRSHACLIALAYLLYPPMHGLQFYDVHFQPIAAPFILLVIDLVDCRRYWLCALAFVVAIGCREDVSIGLAVLGGFLVLSGRAIRPGLVMAVVATAYFGIMTLVVMPWLGKSSFGVWTASYIYKDLIPKGAQSISGVMATLISNPAYTFKTLVVADKLRYALQILVPLAFLPLRRGYLAVALIHGSLLTVLTTGYGPTIDIGFQYGANFIPYVFPASVLALEGMSAPPGGVGRQRAALVTMMLGTALCGVFWGAIPPREAIHGGFDTLPMTRPTPADQQKDEDLRALQALVPPDAWLAVSDHELPHLSRLNILSLKDTTDADYLLYAVGGGFGSERAEKALQAGEFRKIAERPGLVLLQRTKPLPPRDP